MRNFVYLCRTYGAPVFSDMYPGLPAWAKLSAPLALVVLKIERAVQIHGAMPARLEKWEVA